MSASNEPKDPASKKDSPTVERPLAGQIVLVTRTLDQGGSLCNRLSALGADTIIHPVIRILPMDNLDKIDDVISRIAMFDWIVFVSANGVRFFLERLTRTKGLFEPFRQRRFAAIGSSTLIHLSQSAGVEAELTPERSNSEALADALIEVATGQRVLLVRASRGSRELAGRLSQANIEIEELAVYQSVDVDSADPLVAKQIRSQQINWVTMTSSAIAHSTIGLFGDDLRKTKTVSISPTTSAAMIELGFQPDAEARNYNMDGIVEAIVAYSDRG